MALSNKAVLVNLFLNDSLELIMVISDVELQAAKEQGSKEKKYRLKCNNNDKTWKFSEFEVSTANVAGVF